MQVFKAVPYAQPPVESLRFERPVKLVPWQGTKLADTFGPVCPQVSKRQIIGGGTRKNLNGTFNQYLWRQHSQDELLNLSSHPQFHRANPYSFPPSLLVKVRSLHLTTRPLNASFDWMIPETSLVLLGKDGRKNRNYEWREEGITREPLSDWKQRSTESEDERLISFIDYSNYGSSHLSVSAHWKRILFPLHLLPFFQCLCVTYTPLMIDLFQLHCGGNRKTNKLDNVWALNWVFLSPFRLPHLNLLIADPCASDKLNVIVIIVFINPLLPRRFPQTSQIEQWLCW